MRRRANSYQKTSKEEANNARRVMENRELDIEVGGHL